MINQFYNVILCSTSNQVDDVYQKIENETKNVLYKQLDVLTIDQWVTNQYKNYEFINEETIPVKIINSIEEKFIWENILTKFINDNMRHRAHLDINELCEFCIQSNKLISEYEITDQDLKNNLYFREAKFFHSCRQIFYEYVEENHFLTRYDLIKKFTKIIQEKDLIHDQSFLIANIDPDKRNFLRLVSALSKKNQISWLDKERKKVSPETKKYQNTKVEINAVLDWIKECRALKKYNLLIVTPALEQFQTILESKINKAIQPEVYKKIDAKNKLRTKLRRPISSEPATKFINKILLLIIEEELDVATWHSILYYPNWLDEAGLESRQRFADFLKQTKLKELSIEKILFLLSKQNDAEIQSLASLENFLLFIVEKKHGINKKQPIEQFTLLLNEVRDKSNWLKIYKLLPFEISILESINKVVNSINSVIIPNKIDFKKYISVLDYYFENIVPRAQKQNFEVTLSGFLEDHIVEYDAIWLMNMNSCFWPRKINYNPFLSRAILGKYHIKTDDFYDELTKLKIGQLSSKTSSLTLSFAEIDNDLLMTPSLIEHINTSTIVPVKLLKHSLLSHQEFLQDDFSLPIKSDGLFLNRGINTLENQRKCPAWGFYENRCGAIPFETNDPYEITKMEEGSLIHKCLEEFWKKHKTQANLLKLNSQELKNIIREYIDNEIITLHKAKKSISNDLWDCEKEYLHSVLYKWLNFESERSPFEVLDTEKNYEVNIGPLKFNVRIDRIDKLVGGELIILDYKTGNNPISRRGLFSQEIDDLQLAIYACYTPLKKVSGAGVALINRKDNKLYGITSQKNLNLSKTFNAKIDSKEVRTWDELLSQWGQIIKEAALSYKDGECGIKFKDNTEFKYCRILPLLRLPEKKYQYECGYE